MALRIKHYDASLWSLTSAAAPSDSVLRALCINWLTYLLNQTLVRNTGLRKVQATKRLAPDGDGWSGACVALGMTRRRSVRLVGTKVLGKWVKPGEGTPDSRGFEK